MSSRPAITVEDRYVQGGLWVAILVMGCWHVLSVLPIVLSGWLAHGLALGAVLWLVFAVAGTVSAWVVVRGGGRSLALPLTVCAILLAGSMTGSLALPGGVLGHYNWPFAVAGWFGLVALWRQRLGALLTLLAANALTGAAALIVLGQASQLDFARFIELVCGVSVLQVTIYVGSRAVAATARRGAEAADAAARTRIVEMAAEANRTARRNRYEAIRGTAVQLLERLAAGRLDLADPGTRQEVAVSVTRLRRDLVETDDAPDLLSHELRACADAAERRGVAVDLIAASGTIPLLPVSVRRALVEPVIQVLAVTASRARITVISSLSEVVVAIVADASLPGLDLAAATADDVVRCDWDEIEGNGLWAQARWTRSSASLSLTTTTWS